MNGTAVPGPAAARAAVGSDERFFFICAFVMAFIVVAGFSLNLAMGRSSFAVPARFHLHAGLFFGWTLLYVLQNVLAGTGSLTLHRRLGWVAAVWLPLMVISGITLTVANVARGQVPPFFEPVYFLVMNPLHILGVAGLVFVALRLRRQTQWHRRLMFCSMAFLLAPAFGRLLPMPLLIPYAGIAVIAPCLLFPLAGVIRDLRRDGRVHPAWWWGMGAMVGVVLLIQLIAYSAPGLALYEAVTRESAAALPAYEFGMPGPM